MTLLCISPNSLCNLPLSVKELLLTLTAFHLEQGFGQDAPGHTDGLADVVARVLDVYVSNGELTAQRHGETTRLGRLLDGEQQDLQTGKDKRNAKQMSLYLQHLINLCSDAALVHFAISAACTVEQQELCHCPLDLLN